MATEPLRVVVWAAYPALRAGIAGLLRGAGLAPCEVSSLAALDAVETAFDVLVADVASAEVAIEVSGLADALDVPVVLMAPEELAPPAAIVESREGRGWVWRSTGEAELAAVLHAVAAGYVVMEPGALRNPGGQADDRREATEGAGLLTPRELDVLGWLALGLPNKAIALRLGISEHTVKFHVGSVLAKLDASSRTEAVTTAARRGLLTL
ncbi:MAG: LuxR C-terminal-related transcriptional regulator [Dehalococcoidia bacterium]